MNENAQQTWGRWWNDGMMESSCESSWHRLASGDLPISHPVCQMQASLDEGERCSLMLIVAQPGRAGLQPPANLQRPLTVTPDVSGLCALTSDNDQH